MRNKKLLSTVVATTLVATTMAMPVMAADEGSFDVAVTTKTPVIRVVVPTSMEVAVNQFEMGDAGSQIYSNAFEMENKSEIPVKLNVTSTATVPATTTLVATKAEATDSTEKGDAWLAVAAQIDAGKYIATGTIDDLTEANDNVTTFAEKDSAQKAEQTFYLDESSSMAYKLLNAGESATNIAYAQFYELTAMTFTGTDDATKSAEINEALKNQDIYMIATSSIADGATISKLDPAQTVTYADANSYYTVAQTATEKNDIDVNKYYVYGDGTTATTGGKAGFRYIGKLSGEQETWSDDDLSQISVAYSIVGVQKTTYDELAGATGVLTYGLYKDPTPPAPTYTDATAHGFWSGTTLWLAKDSSNGFESSDLTVEVSDGGTTYVELASDKYSLNDANWVSTTWANITAALGGQVSGTAYIRVTDGTTRYTFENK